MNKRFFFAALALVALTGASALKANAQSCPDPEVYGTRSVIAINKNLQAQIEVTYFSTDDPSAFISEKAGLGRSASYKSLDTNQFVARLDSLERSGLASIRKRQSGSSFLGETAELNLERGLTVGDGRFVHTGHASKAYDVSGLDRQTEINVYEGSGRDGGRFRVSVLSWFVDAAQGGSKRFVDYDAIVLLKPGQTAVFKLASSYEQKRGGAGRSYMAVTMRSVGGTSVAPLARGR